MEAISNPEVVARCLLPAQAAAMPAWAAVAPELEGKGGIYIEVSHAYTVSVASGLLGVAASSVLQIGGGCLPRAACCQCRQLPCLFGLLWHQSSRARAASTLRFAHACRLLTAEGQQFAVRGSLACAAETKRMLVARCLLPAQAAAMPVWAAVAPELEGKGGIYIEVSHAYAQLIAQGLQYAERGSLT